MTNDELKTWAEKELAWHADREQGGCDAECSSADGLRAVLALLAREAARGEILVACPHCYCTAVERDGAADSWWCERCGEWSAHEPVHLQRVPKPAPPQAG